MKTQSVTSSEKPCVPSAFAPNGVSNRATGNKLTDQLFREWSVRGFELRAIRVPFTGQPPQWRVTLWREQVLTAEGVTVFHHSLAGAYALAHSFLLKKGW